MSSLTKELYIFLAFSLFLFGFCFSFRSRLCSYEYKAAYIYCECMFLRLLLFKGHLILIAISVCTSHHGGLGCKMGRLRIDINALASYEPIYYVYVSVAARLK